MSRRAHGQFRQSQVITTYGPGALIDLPRHSAIVGGLDTWPSPDKLDEVVEPRLTGKLQAMTGVPAPRLYAPPPRPNEPWAPARGIGAWRFPEWFVVQEATGGGERDRSGRARSGRERSGRRGGDLPLRPADESGAGAGGGERERSRLRDAAAGEAGESGVRGATGEGGGTGDRRPERDRSRRLVHRKALDDKGRFEGRPVVPTRFVRACPRGHVDDLDWAGFVHGTGHDCRRQLWLDERGTTGDLADLVVRCECRKWRRLYEAAELDQIPLGTCRGARPWLGRNTNEDCNQPSRLLIRTASNAYFPQLVSVLSLPDRGAALDAVVGELWDDLGIVEATADLAFIKRKPKVAAALDPFGDAEILHAIRERRGGTGGDRPVKQVELDALLGAPEGFSGDAPADPDFHARRLPDSAWRRPGSGFGPGAEPVPGLEPVPGAEPVPRPEPGLEPESGAGTEFGPGSGLGSRPEYGPGPGTESTLTPKPGDAIASVIQLHRLREVLALVGFTRFEAVTPDIHGEYETDVERAELALDPRWYPAVENRGEGVFVELRTDAVEEWLARPQVGRRLDDLARGHRAWMESRGVQRSFPGGPYVLLHTLSHLLIQSLAMRCGYPASSIRERIYAEPGPDGERFGILLYTGTPDAEGTLGGLVQQARHLEDHLADALRTGALCSNDPICAQHAPGRSMERRWLHGAACHGCALIAETSCEMRNDYLDRALVVPVPGLEAAAFFRAPG